MKNKIRSSRDVTIQTDNWAKAIEFYETILGFPVTHRSPTLMGFETGAFCLYVEKGNRPGPVFDFLVPDMPSAKSRLVAAGCAVVEENPTVPRCYIQDPFGLVLTSSKWKAEIISAPNQSMKPAALLRSKFSVFATTPCRGLSLSR